MTRATQFVRNKIAGLRAMWRFDNRLQLIVNRLLFSRSSDIYVLGGLHVLVDSAGGDAAGTRECLTSPMYRTLLESIHFDSGTTILDLGANGGGFPLLCHHMGIPIKKLVCLELNPNTCQRLRFNLHANLDCEIHVENIGIGGESRVIELELGRGSTGDSIFGTPSSSVPLQKGYRIALLTLDDIFERFLGSDIVDLCKMDIEGAEHEVMAGSGRLSLSRCRHLIIELHDAKGAQMQEVTLDRIKALGFTVLRRSDDYPDVYLLKNMAI